MTHQHMFCVGWSFLVVSTWPACLELDPSEARGMRAYQAFLDHAEPVLVERCANPSCHGQSSRPLSVFAPQRHRENSADTYLTTPLTTSEHRRNYQQALSFIASPAANSELLRKPLDSRSGGIAHEGGSLFHDRSDYNYRRILEWLEQELDHDPESEE